jgi:hypothetical protein
MGLSQHELLQFNVAVSKWINGNTPHQVGRFYKRVNAIKMQFLGGYKVNCSRQTSLPTCLEERSEGLHVVEQCIMSESSG